MKALRWILISLLLISLTTMIPPPKQVIAQDSGPGLNFASNSTPSCVPSASAFDEIFYLVIGTDNKIYEIRSPDF